MSQYYSDESREDDAYSLPDVEIFYHEQGDYPDSETWEDGDGEERPTGYYFWYCFPGCMPDSDPVGPFDTEEEAIAAMRDGNE